MYQINYHRASSVDEAVSMISAAAEGKYVSGGMTLIATMKQRLAAPSDLVDLRHVDSMKGIKVDGRNVRIGGAVTHAEVASSAAIRSVCPALCELAGLIGDPHVRHMGTIGGSIANNDPAADYPAAMLALNATIITNRREIAADQFFTGLFETALEDGEILTAVSFNAPDKAGFAKFRNPASRYAMASVFVAKSGGTVRTGVAGAGSSGAFRHQGIEAALSSNWMPDAASGVQVDSSGLLSDIHASAEYRANLVKVMTKRAVAAAG
jgi:aerobic carbon-monoxide dehydrogenase medium subunit